MIIIDSELKKREAAGKLLRVGMIGAGFMGLGLANQIVNYTPGMTLTAIANRTVKHAHQAYENAGRDGVVEAQTLGTLEDAMRQGQPVITGNADWLCESEQIDILVEATGHVEFGAHVAMKAIACSKDMVLIMTSMYDLDMLREHGGIVDYALGASPSPGVFVFAEGGDPIRDHYLYYGKLGQGPLYSFYVPYHLTILEVPLSLARVALLRDPVIVPKERPFVDVVAVAKQALNAGEAIDGLGGFKTYGLCENAAVVSRDRLLPMGIAEDARLKRNIPRDQVLTLADVELAPGKLCVQLRQKQDVYFG